MRLCARIAVLVLALFGSSAVVSGCGYVGLLVGSAIAGNAQSGGSDAVATAGGDTAAEIFEVPHGAGGPVQTVRVRLSDRFARPFAVGLEHRAAPAAPFARAKLVAVRRTGGAVVRADGAGFTSTGTLEASEVGTDYDLDWEFAGDLGGPGARSGVDLQLVVDGGGGIQGGVAFALSNQRIGNDPPEVADVALDVGAEGAVVRFRARDSSGDPIRVNALFRVDGGPATALTAVVGADLVAISTTAALGDAIAFAWRTTEEPLLAGLRAVITVEVVPVDDGLLAGLAVTSNAVAIANNAPPRARIISTPARAHAATASVLFALDDAEGDTADVAIRWELLEGSLPGGVTGGAAASASGDDVTALETDGRAHGFTWAYASDLGGNAPRRVRLVVTPSGAGGAAGATPAFDVGNDAPVVEIARPFATAVGGDVAVSFTLADASRDPAGLVLEVRAGAATTFTAAALAGAAAGLASGLPGAPASHSVVWRSGIDLPDTSGLPVSLRLRAVDGLTDGLGAPDEVSTAVTNVGGGGGGSPDPPTIARVTPAGGRPEGGARVTIAGGGFVAGATTATIGGVSLTGVVVSSESALTGVAPGGAAGAATVAVTTAFGTASLPGGFTYQDGPAIGAVSPEEGPRGGGALVTITGAGFGAGAAARVGGVALTGLERVDDGTLRGTTGASTAGPADVEVTTPEGRAVRAGGFRYLAPPVVAAVSPSSGPLGAGTAVAITGSGFLAAAVTVTVDGAPLAARVVVSDGLITATLPAHAAGAVTVAVTTAGGTTPAAGAFTYRAAPTIATVTPERGPAAGGTTITVAGAGFVAGATEVLLGGAPVAGVSVASAASLQFDAPAGSGARDLVVRTAGGAATRLAGFTYVQPLAVASMTPAQGNTSGGQAVTIVGAGFDGGALTATLGGAPLGALTLVSPSVLAGTAPAGAAGTVALEVTTALGGTVTAPAAFTYTEAPVIASITPLEGPLAGGTDLAISGSGFSGGAVLVGGAGLDALSVTPTRITGRTRARAAGAVEVRVTTGGGAAAVPQGFRFLAPPEIQAIAPDAGPTTGGTPVLVTGAGFVASAVTVTVGGATVTATVLDDGRLSFTAPAGAAGAVAVSVATPGGATSSAAAFTYIEVPTVATVSPARVPAAGGATVTVVGTGFVAGATEVRVGGAPVSGVSVASATSLSFAAPAGAGTADLEVRTPGGATSTAAAYTYVQPLSLASITPATSSTGGGQAVAVVGAGFDGGSLAVTLDGIALGSLTVVSPTLAVGTAPAHAVGTVTLSASTTLGGTVSLAGAFSYTEAPVIGAIAPSEGPIAGGTTIAISGSGLAGATVSVGGDGLDALVIGSTLITGRTRARAGGPGAVPVRVETASGVAVASAAFRFLAAPALASVAPVEGPLGGGTAVLLSGTGFLASAVTVTMGGAQVAAAVLDDGRIAITTPAGVAGGASISVTTPGGTTTTAAAFTYRAAPTITTVSPERGPSAGASTLAVTGSGFVPGATEVLLGGAAVGGLVVSTASTLSFAAPGGAGPVDLVVRTAGGSATRLAAFRYVAPLEVLSIAPARGSVEGGQVVTILGAGFDGGSVTATLGGTPLGSLTLVSPSVLTGTAPTGAAGAVDLAVTTDIGGTFTLVDAFAYAQGPVVTSVTPVEGPIAGGTPIAIAGSGLSGATVALGGDPLADLVVTPTLVSGRTPAHFAALVDLTVATSGGAATVERAFRFLAPPVATSFDPVSGPVEGGTRVTLSGAGFRAAAVTVTVDGAPVAATVIDDARISVTMPAHGVGLAGIALTTPGGTTVTAAGFSYLAVPTITAVTPEHVPVGGQTTVTISGAGFVSGATEVFLEGNLQFPTHVVDASTITFTAGFGNGAVDVEVRTPGGAALREDALTFVFALAAHTVLPDRGPAAGGTAITVLGLGFDGGALSASLGGVPLTSVTVVSREILTAIAPPLPAGPANLVISNSIETVTKSAAFTAIEAPRIVTISPLEGSAFGGTPLTISGTGFTGATALVDGRPLLQAVVTPTRITGVTDFGNVGPVEVRVTAPGGVATAPAGFRFLGGPGISNVSPGSGPIGGGTALLIEGSGFLAASVTVTVGATPTAAVVLSDTRIALTTTAAPAGPVDVTIETAGGVTTATAAFTYLAAPTVTSITPATGLDAGGEEVTIVGAGFVPGATEITFGGISLVSPVVSESQITGFTPARPVGAVAVRVITAGGTATAAFAYTGTGGVGPGGLSVTHVTPAVGPASGGTPITIVGTGFVPGSAQEGGIDPFTTVTIGGAPLLDAIVLGPTAIFGRTPGGAPGVKPVVVSVAGQGAATLPAGFEYFATVSFTQAGRDVLERDGSAGRVAVRLVLSTGGDPLAADQEVVVQARASSAATIHPAAFPDAVLLDAGDAFLSLPMTVTFPAGSADGAVLEVGSFAALTDFSPEEEEVAALEVVEGGVPSGAIRFEPFPAIELRIVDDDVRVATLEVPTDPATRAFIGEERTLAWTVEGPAGAPLVLDPGGAGVTGLVDRAVTPFPAGVTPPATVEPGVVYSLAARAGSVAGERFELRAADGYGAPGGTPSTFERTEVGALRGEDSVIAFPFSASFQLDPEGPSPLTIPYATGRSFGVSDLVVARIGGDRRPIWAKVIVNRNIPGDISASSGAPLTLKDLIVAPDGDIVLIGTGKALLDFGGGVELLSSRERAFVARLRASDGAVRWARLFGPANNDMKDFVRSGAVLRDGAVVVGGQYLADSGASQNALQVFNAAGATDGAFTLPTTTGAQEDGYLLRFDPDGRPAWARRIQGTTIGTGSRRQRVYGVAPLPDGGFAAAGAFELQARFDAGLPSAVTLVAGASREAIFVTRHRADGAVVWARQVETAGSEFMPDVGIPFPDPLRLATTPDGGIVLSGETRAGIIYSDATQFPAGVFIARFHGDGTLAWRTGFNDAPAFPGDGLRVEDLEAFVDGSVLLAGHVRGSVADSISFAPDEPEAITLGPANPFRFLARFRADGGFAWASVVAPKRVADDARAGVATRPDGSFVYGGRFASQGGPITIGAGDEGAASITPVGSNPNVFFATFGPRSYKQVRIRPQGLAFVEQTSTESAGRIDAAHVAAFPDGSSVVAGSFSGDVTFGAGAGAVRFNNASGPHPYVARYEADGRLRWVRSGGENVAAHGVTAHSDGRTVVVGAVTGTASFGGLALSAPNEADFFAAAFGATGTALWVVQGGQGRTTAQPLTQLLGSRASAVAPLSDGRVVVAGLVAGATDNPGSITFSSGGAAVTTTASGPFALAIRSDGALEGLQLGAGASSPATALAALGDGPPARSGATILAGSIGAAGVQIGAFSLVRTGTFDDGFVARFADGDLAWVRKIDGSGELDVTGAVLLPSGESIVVGSFTGVVSFGVLFDRTASGRDIFVVRYGVDGSILRTEVFGGTGDERGARLARKGDGTLVLAATFTSGFSFGAGPDAVPVTIAPGAAVDAFVARLQDDLTPLWVRRIGNDESSSAAGKFAASPSAAITPDGTVLFAGTFNAGTVLCAGEPRDGGLVDPDAGSGDPFLFLLKHYGYAAEDR